jgi:hypothetical protein
MDAAEPKTIATLKFPAAPAEIPSEGLTAGQRQLLAALSAEQREALAAMSERKRAEVLAPHEKGFDPHLLGFQVRSGFFRAPRPVAPPDPPPTDTAELIGRLPGADPHWVQLAAEDLARQFGEKKDRSLWGEFQKIMLCVFRGLIDPAAVIDAYRQARKPECQKPGAVFWTAFQGPNPTLATPAAK